MSELLKIFSTRELALFFWIAVFLTVMVFKNSFRHSLAGAFRAFFVKRVVIAFSILTAYVFVSVLLLQSLNLWNVVHLKDTGFWFFSFAIIGLINIPKAKNSGYFQKTIKESIKWTIFIEFLVSFYTFSFFAELSLLPVIIFISVLEVSSQGETKDAEINKVLSMILSLIGLSYFLITLFKTFENYKSLLTLDNLNAFFLPIILTVTIIPYFYFLALYNQYELLLNKADHMTEDLQKRKKLKKNSLVASGLNLDKVVRIRKKLNKFDFYHSKEIKAHVQSLLLEEEQESVKVLVK